MIDENLVYILIDRNSNPYKYMLMNGWDMGIWTNDQFNFVQFDSQEDAEQYCKDNNIAYDLSDRLKGLMGDD